MKKLHAVKDQVIFIDYNKFQQTIYKWAVDGVADTQIISDCEGSLLDYMVIENYGYKERKGIKLRQARPRHYIIVLEHYLNCWSSDYKVIFTDDEKKALSYADQFNRWREADEQEAEQAGF